MGYFLIWSWFFFLHLVSQPINTIKYKLQRMSMEITYGGDKNNFTANST